MASASPLTSPGVLQLAELLIRGRWDAVAEGLYREVASLAECAPGMEVLVAGCGDGGTAAWLAGRTGAAVTGVDPDAERIRRAEAAKRASGKPGPDFEVAPLDDLPHETAVFDCVIGTPAVAAAGDADRALRELVRVTKPMGTVFLIQPAWTAELTDRAREGVASRLGIRPRHVVEWKRILREVGLVEIEAQDWGAGGQPLARRTSSTGAQPVIGAPRLTWRHKVHIVGHAWRRWGIRDVRHAVAREADLLRELASDRALGLVLFRGVKWPHARGT